MGEGTDPLLSVVIPVHDGVATIGEQLDAVRAGGAGTPDIELVIVDNCSTDGTAAAVERWADASHVPARVVVADAVVSEGHARNVGLATARSDQVAFCDADDVVSPAWVEAMRGALAEHAFVTGPVELERLNPAWLAQSRGRAFYEHTPLLFDRIPFAHGCNLGVHRTLALDAGGFDEGLAIGVDADFALKLWKRGVTLAFEPDAVVHYRLRQGLRDRWRQARAYGRARSLLRRRVPEVVDRRGELRANARRAAWLARHAPETVSRRGRARWTWVAAQLVGEAGGELAVRRGGRRAR